MSNYPPGVTVADIDRWFGDDDDTEPTCKDCDDVPFHPVTGDVCGVCTVEVEL